MVKKKKKGKKKKVARKGIRHSIKQQDRSFKGFHIMAKPIGPVCNLRCTYCFYTEKDALFPKDENYRMSDEVLEAYVRKYIASQRAPEVPFVWQGGEPTLMGLDFFHKVVRLQQRYSGVKRIKNSLQTNGTLLNDEWCRFMARHRFLVGFSLDGPEDIHNLYRVGRRGRPTFKTVMNGLKLMQKHGVEFNVLACVTRESARRPLDVYHFLKEQGVQYIQFIPVVERKSNPVAKNLGLRLASPPALNEEETEIVTPWTVEPGSYGDFLIQIFDEWVRQDVSSVFVMNFEWALAAWAGVLSSTCNFAPRCGRSVIIEHNGNIYSCDHFVYPDYRLGNVVSGNLKDMIESDSQVAFGAAKETALPQYCRQCNWLFACHGECPKHRFVKTPTGEPGWNYLCRGYERFFNHVDPYMRSMVRLLEHHIPVKKIMEAVERPLVIKLEP